MDVPAPTTTGRASALDLLHGIAGLLQKAAPDQNVLEEALQLIASELGYERMLITAMGTARDLARGEAAIGLSSDQLARARYHLGEGIVGRVLDSGRAVLVPCVDREPEFLNRAGARTSSDRKQLAFL